MADSTIRLDDLKRAVLERHPEAGDLIVRYLEQPDPPEDRPEGAREAATTTTAFNSGALRTAVHPNTLSEKTSDEQHAARRAAWRSMLDAPYHPPRFDLGPWLITLYETKDVEHRRVLIDVFLRARLGWGVWQAFKHIYKRAEVGHDFEMFGALAWRLDALDQTPHHAHEILPGTRIYMRRRAWRYLRELGRAVPEIYPDVAVQVLRHYPARASFTSSWVASQIWAHEDLLNESTAWISGPPKKLSKRFMDEAWKATPAPLLRLLETAQNDTVCTFAIRSLEADFEDLPATREPAWLARIAARRLPAVDRFVVGILQARPELHATKLEGLGLRDTVLGFLESDDESARKFAVAYARAHAPDLPVDLLVKLTKRPAEVREFAVDRLGRLTPKAIGLDHLVALVPIAAATKLAEAKLREGFRPGDLTADHFIALFNGRRESKAFVEKFFAEREQPIPASHYIALLEHPGCGWTQRREALKALGKRTGKEIGIEWIKEALLDRSLSSTVQSWLRAGMLTHRDVDAEWVKGLVMRPSLRDLAIAMLGNAKIVRPKQIGLPWLLTMTRQTDEALASFAHRYLLEHFTPDDFGGIDRLWSLATGAKETEPIRRFAQTYLLSHHPEIGKTHAEAKTLGITPRLKHEDFDLIRIRPFFFDDRADVRRLAATVGRSELLRWNEPGLLYELADSPNREGRGLAAAALFGIGDERADLSVPADWLQGPRTFLLAESRVKATREIALTLIRRHYDRIGSAARLAWLMESPDRDVRLFAVRLFWARHRPREIPTAWTPTKGTPPTGGEAFESVETVRTFLRTVLFGLPPGRMERRELSDDAAPDRALPASVAKRRLIETVRDLAVDDASFAHVVVPVLDEISASAAKGEWQACVAALARIRRSHPDTPTSLAAAVRS